MDKMLSVVKKYNLEYYFNIVLTKNEGNTNPYHNFFHTLCVFMSCYAMGKVSFELEDKDVRLILIAALFHDFNHSGGKLKNDSENVKIALEAFEKYSTEDLQSHNFIKGLIECTTFPFDKEKDKHLSLSQMIIRDADLLQFTKNNFIQQILIGLNKEFGNDSTNEKILQDQIKFMKNAEFFTDFAKEKVDKILEDRVHDCEYLIETFKRGN